AYWDTFQTTMIMFRNDNGVSTSIGSGTFTLTANDVIRIEVISNALTGYANGVSKVTATDSTYASRVGAIYGDPSLGGTPEQFTYEEQAAATQKHFILVRS